MTSHRPQRTPYIGRVGALAVALGVGYALASGHGMGIARADDTESSSPAGSPSSSSESSDATPADAVGSGAADPAPAIESATQQTTSADSEADAPVAFRRPPPKMELSVSGGAQIADPAGDDTHVDKPAQVDADEPEPAAEHESKKPRPVADSPVKEVVDTVSTADTVSATAEKRVATPADTPVPDVAHREKLDPPPAARVAAFTVEPATVGAAAPTVAPRIAAAVAPTPPAADPLQAVAATVVRVVADVITAFTHWVSPPPGTPAPAPPTLWAVLAWVRREVQTAFFNRTPVADPTQDVTLHLTGPSNVATIDLAALADDPDVGDTLTYSVPAPGQTGSPTHGTIAVDDATGVLTYTPDGSGARADSFVVTVSDATSPAHLHGPFGFLAPDAGHTTTITVNLVIANTAPVASADTATTDEDAPVRIDVLANDSDVDGDTPTVLDYTQPARGTVTRNVDGSLTYTPNPDTNGTDTFSYTVSDGIATSTTAIVTVTVTPVPDAPVARTDSYRTAEDTPLTVSTGGVLANDTDADGDALNVVEYQQPQYGAVTLRADGTFDYTPSPDFQGIDTFTYVASDGTHDSAPTTVTITVDPANDAPAGSTDAYGAVEDTPLVVDAAHGVLANDTDLDGDALTIQRYTQPTKGTVVLNDDGSFTYTPNPNANGTDSFTYVASDGSAETASTTVTVTVRAVPDAPVANPDAYTTDENTPITVDAAHGLLANDTDADGDTLQVIFWTASDQIRLTTDGSFTYTPAPGFHGTETLEYGLFDGENVTRGTVTFTVDPANQAPTLGGGPDFDRTVSESGVITAQLDAADADGDDLTYGGDFDGTYGKLAVDANGRMTYTPDVDAQIDALLIGGTRSDTFTITATDPSGASASTTATFTVTPYSGPEAGQLEATYDEIQGLRRAIRDANTEERRLIQVLALIQSGGGDTSAAEQLLGDLRRQRDEDKAEDRRLSAELEALRAQIVSGSVAV